MSRCRSSPVYKYSGSIEGEESYITKGSHAQVTVYIIDFSSPAPGGRDLERAAQRCQKVVHLTQLDSSYLFCLYAQPQLLRPYDHLC